MANVAQPSLAEVGAKAAAILADIQNKGVDATDKKSIVDNSKKLVGLIDALQPHINTAQNAFGGQEAAISQANDLRNKLNKVIAAYS